MRSRAKDVMPSSVRRALKALGTGVNVARRKRRLPVRHVTDAAGISAGTLRRIEQGDPSVSLGALAMVLLSLGEVSRLEDLLPPATDHLGLALDLDTLPRRIADKRSRGGEEL